MKAALVAQIIRQDVSKDHLIDLADEARACRKIAAEHALYMGLTGKSANRITGMATYELMEKRLYELTESVGGFPLEAGCFPGTTLRNYQTLGRHGRVLIGRASMSEIGALPSANLTRTHGAMLNSSYGTQPYLDGLAPASTEELLYVLLLTCRDSRSVKDLAEVAIGVLEPDFSGFIMYETIDRFLGGYGAIPDPATPRGPDDAQSLGLSLKPKVQPFIGGEARPELREDEGKAS
jgi:hypothetical protein